MEKSKLTVVSSPHLHCGMDTPNIMLDVIIALMPAAAASVWLFGWRAAAVIAVSVGSCVAAEFLSRLVMKRPQTVGDLSAVVTGLLLAFNLPATIPLWQGRPGRCRRHCGSQADVRRAGPQLCQPGPHRPHRHHGQAFLTR